jgi:hypothetical protein
MSYSNPRFFKWILRRAFPRRPAKVKKKARICLGEYYVDKEEKEKRKKGE